MGSFSDDASYAPAVPSKFGIFGRSFNSESAGVKRGPPSPRFIFTRLSRVGLAQDSRLCQPEWLCFGRTTRLAGHYGLAFPPRICPPPHRSIEEGGCRARPAHLVCQQFGQHARNRSAKARRATPRRPSIY